MRDLQPGRDISVLDQQRVDEIIANVRKEYSSAPNGGDRGAASLAFEAPSGYKFNE